jgi:YHS domain-containing protein
MKQFFFTPARYVFALVLAYASFVFNTQAQTAINANKKLYNVSGDRLAIQGYDPVAYFTDNSAQEGKKDIAYVYDGVTYRFASVQHLQSFKSDPERYQPQYGGWCAYAMGATGEKVDVDPETFKLLNGKLYLFYNRFFNNTKKSWDKDEANLKQKADLNWQKIAR